jgi:16S rRNA (guanine(966)-N(2))-methyltransferase RsmD
MPDRVREAVFSMLGARYDTPGALPPLHVADVFAGTGSLGIEALSRGAASCVFFEREREALRVLRGNLDALGVGPEGVVVSRDAWVAALPRAGAAPFGLVFLDPPYEDARDASPQGAVWRFLLELSRAASERPRVVLHHPRSVVYAATSDGPWVMEDSRSYGTNQVTMFV